MQYACSMYCVCVKLEVACHGMNCQSCKKICTRLTMYIYTVELECIWFCIELYHRSDKSQA